MSKIFRGEKITAIIISIFFLLFYISNQTASIYGGDAGDLVSAAYVHGIAHPPGYPLYTFLGWLLTKIPISTVAWRVTLLSSVSAALSLGVYYLLLNYIFKHKLLSIIGVFTLGFTYLYWLYASVPEVFMLNNLFAVSLTFLSLKFYKTINIRYFYILIFIFGLSLANHHTILLLAPVFGYIIYLKRSLLIKRKVIFISIFLFCCGLLPYIYIFLSAASKPLVSWEDLSTLQGFFNLISRKMYGTFTAHSAMLTVQSTISRFTQLNYILETLVIDFTKLGIILGIIGIFIGWKNKPFWYIFILFAFILTGPIFIMYAHFPTFTNFLLATSERFLLLAYLFFNIFLVKGIEIIYSFIDKFIKKLKLKKIKISSAYILLILPISLLLTNIPKITPLTHDQTAENFVDDIITSAPDNSIIFLMDDTNSFDTLYVYLTQNDKFKIKNKKIVQLGILNNKYYRDILKQFYPELVFTDTSERNLIISDFIDKYYKTYPVLSSHKLAVTDNLTWLNQGLLYRLFQKEDMPNTDNFINNNLQLFSSLHDPLDGALKDYNHVMLADVRRIYAERYASFAQSLFILAKYNLATDFYQKSLQFESNNKDNRIGFIWSLLMERKCDDSEGQLEILKNNFPAEPEYFKLMAKYYDVCRNDLLQSKKYIGIYNEAINNNQIDLNKF